ncbi:MAG: hypothetical protein M1820_006432 [Bogoriella megaspora]|nr:MAG: hypothetical protein M1820_006432 [Bogoriella megaspora]
MFRSIVAISLLAGLAASQTNTSATTTLVATATGTGLNDAAKATGKLYFGTAADIPGDEQSDTYYLAEYNNTSDFGATTPANIMKYEFTEPAQGQFNYTQADQFVALAQASNKLIRCHNLIWKSELPTWLTSGNWTNATLSAVLTNHVTNLITHFGNECYAWDVVNEALNDDGSGDGYDNSSIWYQVIGPAYVPLAFQAATQAVQAANLSVKLYYNDYNIENPGTKSTGAQTIVSQLKAWGLQIDGVGLESHFIVGETPDQATQQSNMEAFTALGVDVAITELDVRLTLPATEETETQQVVDYYNSVAACVAVDGCVGITVWDFVDTYSWIPSTFTGQGYGDLFLQANGANTPLTKKAAYDGALEALTGQAEAVKVKMH